MEIRSIFIYMIRPTHPGFVEQMLPEEEAAMQAHFAYLITLCPLTALDLADIAPVPDSADTAPALDNNHHRHPYSLACD